MDAFLERLLRERGGDARAAGLIKPELPVWHLGGVGALQRKEISGNVG
jgi:hypothetical protein